MSKFNAQSYGYQPSSPWQLSQNHLDAPSSSIRISESRKIKTVISTESYVNHYWRNGNNDNKTTQQVTSVSQPSPKMIRNNETWKSNNLIRKPLNLEGQSDVTISSPSQLTFARAGPSKSFITSNALTQLPITSGNESQMKLPSSDSTSLLADSVISSNKLLSQRNKEFIQKPAPLRFYPPKKLSQANAILNELKFKPKKPATCEAESNYTVSTEDDVIKSIVQPETLKTQSQTTSSSSLSNRAVPNTTTIKSKELTRMSTSEDENPKYGYAQPLSNEVVIQSNDFIHSPTSKPESTYIWDLPKNTSNGFFFHDSSLNEKNDNETSQELTSVTQSSIMLLEPESTDDETMEFNDLPQVPTTLENDFGVKYSLSPAGAGSHNTSIASNESYQSETKTFVNDSEITLPSLKSNCHLEDSYSLISSNDRNTPGKAPRRELLPIATQSYPITYLNNDHMMSNEVFQQTTSSELNTATKLNQSVLSYPTTLSYNLDGLTAESGTKIPLIEVDQNYSKQNQSDVIKSAALQHAKTNEIGSVITFPSDQLIYSLAIPSATVTSNTFDVSPLNTTSSALQHETTQGVESDISLSYDQLIYSQATPSATITSTLDVSPLNTTSSALQHETTQGVESDLTLPYDQLIYSTAVPSATVTSITSGVKPLNAQGHSNKVIIQSNDLIKLPTSSTVQSTYARSLPNKAHKISNQLIETPTTSNGGSVIASNRLALQSKLKMPVKVKGVNSTRPKQGNAVKKTNGPLKQPTSALKTHTGSIPESVTYKQAAENYSKGVLNRNSKLMKVVPKDKLPHPLSEHTFAKPTPLKRKMKENASPPVPAKKPLLQNPVGKVTTTQDTITFPNISIERIIMVGGVKKKVAVPGIKLIKSSEINSENKTISDCLKTLLKNNINIIWVQKKPVDKIAQYFATLEKNNVSVVKLKKQ